MKPQRKCRIERNFFFTFFSIVKNKLNWFVCFYWNGNVCLSTIHLQFILFHISIYLKPLENYDNNLVACNRVLCGMNNLFGDINDWMRSVLPSSYLSFGVVCVKLKKAKKVNAKNIVLFGLVCCSLSFKMHFCCTDLKSIRQRKKEQRKNRDRTTNVTISMWHDSICVGSIEKGGQIYHAIFIPFFCNPK